MAARFTGGAAITATSGERNQERQGGNQGNNGDDRIGGLVFHKVMFASEIFAPCMVIPRAWRKHSNYFQFPRAALKCQPSEK
jgi:hypothetical protein